MAAHAKRQVAAQMLRSRTAPPHRHLPCRSATMSASAALQHASVTPTAPSDAMQGTSGGIEGIQHAWRGTPAQGRGPCRRAAW